MSDDVNVDLKKGDVTVSPYYYSAANEIVEPDKVLVTTRYFVRRWMPALGENGTRIVLALRSLGFYDRKTGETRDGIEIDLPELAALIGISVPTLKREFGERHGPDRKAVPGSQQNPALHKFVQKERQYWRDPVTNRLLRTANVYRVMMDDPIHGDDLPRLREILEKREKGGAVPASKAHFEPKPPKRRAGPGASKAQSESRADESDSKETQSHPDPSQSQSAAVESEPTLIEDSALPLSPLCTPPDGSDFSASLFSGSEGDVLDALPAGELAALEMQARARVIAEHGEPVRSLAKAGKAWTTVRPMMRKIFAEKDGLL